MTKDAIRVHIEVTYNGVMLARDEGDRLIARARRYAALRTRVREGLQTLHGQPVAFTMIVGSPRAPRADRLRALKAPPAG